MNSSKAPQVVPWGWFSGLAALLLGRINRLGKEVSHIATTVDQLMSTLTELQAAQGQLITDLSTVEQQLTAANQNPSVNLDPALSLVQSMLSNAAAVHQSLTQATANPPAPATPPAAAVPGS